MCTYLCDCVFDFFLKWSYKLHVVHICSNGCGPRLTQVFAVAVRGLEIC